MISRNIKIALLSIGIFTFYLLSMPRTVTLEDDGLFILSSYFRGVSHPPGYPLHSLLGYLFTHLPIGNPAFNGHALSALFSALSSTLIFFITSLLVQYKNRQYNQKDDYIAYTSAVAFALSSTVWSQSIITEVYSLNAFLFLCVLYLAIQLDISLNDFNIKNKIARSKLRLFYLGIFSGLAIANHWPLFLLGSIGILFILLKHTKFIIRYWYIASFAFVIGLTPYLWLYINSNSDTIIKFLGPIESWSDFYNYVSRKNFNHGVDFSPTATILDKLYFIIFTLKQLVNQWGVLNSLFVPIAIVVIFREKGGNKHWYIALLISYLSSSILLAAILGYDFNIRHQTNFQPFLVLSHTIGAILFALGIDQFIKYLQTKTPYKLKTIVFIIVFFQTITANGLKNYRSNYIWSDIYAKQVLDSLKPNSILIVSGDEGTGTIGYWNLIKGYRKDVVLIQEAGEIINNTRLFDPRRTSPKDRKKIMLDFIQSSTKPVYLLYNYIGVSTISHWLVYEYSKDSQNGNVKIKRLNPTLNHYLDFIFSDIEHTDSWTMQFQHELRKRALAHLVLEISLTNNSYKKDKYLLYIKKIASNLNGLVYTFSVLKYLKKSHYFLSENDFKIQGRKYFNHEQDKEDKARFLNLLAKLDQEKGDLQKSLNFFQQSADIWNSSANRANQKISEIKDLLN